MSDAYMHALNAGLSEREALRQQEDAWLELQAENALRDKDMEREYEAYMREEYEAYMLRNMEAKDE